MRIWFVLAIMGRCIEGKSFSTGKRCMWILISGWQIDNFEMLRTASVTGCGGWCFGQRWDRLWSLPSASVGWRYTCSFVSPVCLRISSSAMLAWKASGLVGLTKQSWVSFYLSLPLCMSRKLNIPHLLFLDLGASWLDQILHFLYRGVQKPSPGHFSHVQGQAHVRLFQLYTTSLPGHHSRHVEYLQEICCCFKQWDVANTSTVYTSVAFSKVIKDCLVHSRGCFSGNSCARIAEFTTSWYWILRTVRTNAFVDHGGFMLRAAINWSCSSRHTPALR